MTHEELYADLRKHGLQPGDLVIMDDAQFAAALQGHERCMAIWRYFARRATDAFEDALWYEEYGERRRRLPEQSDLDIYCRAARRRELAWTAAMNSDVRVRLRLHGDWWSPEARITVEAADDPERELTDEEAELGAELAMMARQSGELELVECVARARRLHAEWSCCPRLIPCR